MSDVKADAAFRSTVPSLEIIRHDPFNAETPERALATDITPSAHAYVRTNFGVPVVAGAPRIEVTGTVRRPLSLTMDALNELQQRTITATMECAGNDRLGMHPLPAGEPWRHGALSTVTWTGFALADVLQQAECAPDAVEVLFSAADAGSRDDADGRVRFARSLPVADALAADVLLAVEMNGEPLTPDHGAPVRLVVPGWYGMASVKWLTHIEVLRVPFAGYFQRERYVYDDPSGVAPVDRMRVKSIITSPLDGAHSGRRVAVEGWAWSGNGAITAVEVCVDGGNAWQPAVLGASVSAHAWTPWHMVLELPRAGRIVLRSRATDASGAVQPDVIVWNRLGYGNNAIRQVVVEVD
jgi:DMSO/TMAO reductase YedYZ molybdopterin-dependent catalytic subunit